jgi:hypothetical protein
MAAKEKKMSEKERKKIFDKKEKARKKKFAEKRKAVTGSPYKTAKDLIPGAQLRKTIKRRSKKK